MARVTWMARLGPDSAQRSRSSAKAGATARSRSRPLQIARGAALGDEGGAVLGKLDDLALAVVGLVVRDAGGTVEHAHGEIVGDQRQGATGGSGGTE